MNIAQLRYVVEIEKTQSITKAAENLYMGQPNLSRSIRELENELGFRIFKRSQKGMVPTPKGEKLLLRAKRILEHVDAIEGIHASDSVARQQFSLIGPRASYVAYAVTRLAASLSVGLPMYLDYKETNAVEAIEAVESKAYGLGIVRYQHQHEDAFLTLFRAKNLRSEEISCFTYQLLLSQKHPLAAKEQITQEDLSSYIEISHGDPYYQSMHLTAPKQEQNEGGKHIYVYERGSEFDLLSGVPAAYMWSGPVPAGELARFGLALRPCQGVSVLYKDVLISRKNYRMTEVDRRFIDELTFTRREVFQ